MDRHQQELQELREIRKELKEQGELLGAEGQALHHLVKEVGHVLQELRLILRLVRPRLSAIEINFTGADMPLGPVTLKVGQKTKATVVGFDQFGQPFTGPIPSPSYSIDNPALDSLADDGAGGSDVTSLAEGVANFTATVTSAEGLSLSDTETITNSPADVPVPVLSSVKVSFTDPS